jgi:polysaccharide export outer membrane protein
MKGLLPLFLALLLCVLISGCKSESVAVEVPLAPATMQSNLGPGDIFQLEIVGESDLPTQYQVAADGTVSFPYIGLMAVSGLEPQELAAKVKQDLIEKEILLSPSVIVSVQEYRSKRVSILGEVNKPGSFPVTPQMTLLQLVSQAGGLSSLALVSRVNLTRTTGKDVVTVTINIQDIYEGRTRDVLLQAGDKIYVHERVF